MAIMLSGHVIGLLKEYMQDLVEQARQETSAQERFGFAATVYRPDHAISDLLALLDDRIESEGMQVGLPEGFLHEIWSLCNQASVHVADRVYVESNVGSEAGSKARTRELTYRALLAFIEARGRASAQGEQGVMES
ncbi:hypothetical protein [Nitrospira lenta]|uniref:Uncharacterized protein n=1 Tax=Nitrospira lenta TaxID=1436998 RepID=A0A330L7F4_9BACT|nr:hypothetical protein [Nitrospira lenta]SPP64915.1 conserved hypothetical protein [Nitrospira lenta]